MPKKGYKRTLKHQAKLNAARNTPEEYVLIQQYGSSLINKLRQVYTDLNWRCTNPNADNYKWYGGIGVENEFTSKLDFLNYVIFEMLITTFEQIDGLELDRIDAYGNYTRGNIRFVTRKQNRNNRRK